MKRAWVALVGILAACGGKQSATLSGNCAQVQLPESTLRSPSGNPWSCTLAGAAGARTVPACPSAIAAGGSGATQMQVAEIEVRTSCRVAEVVW
jgi:hypothetical protein